MATSIVQGTYVKTALRLPPKLHQAVHAAARESGRSYNAELIHLIELGLQPPASVMSLGPDGAVMTMTTSEIVDQLDALVRRAGNMVQSIKLTMPNLDPQSLGDIESPPEWGEDLPPPDELAAPATKAVRKAHAPRAGESAEQRKARAKEQAAQALGKKKA